MESTDQLLRNLDNLQRELRQAQQEAAEQRHIGVSDDRRVVAVVDGAGRVVVLQIPDAELRSSHPGAIGAKIVSAVHEARREAGQSAGERLARILPNFE